MRVAGGLASELAVAEWAVAVCAEPVRGDSPRRGEAPRAALRRGAGDGRAGRGRTATARPPSRRARRGESRRSSASPGLRIPPRRRVEFDAMRVLGTRRRDARLGLHRRGRPAPSRVPPDPRLPAELPEKSRNAEDLHRGCAQSQSEDTKATCHDGVRAAAKGERGRISAEPSGSRPNRAASSAQRCSRRPRRCPRARPSRDPVERTPSQPRWPTYGGTKNRRRRHATSNSWPAAQRTRSRSGRRRGGCRARQKALLSRRRRGRTVARPLGRLRSARQTERSRSRTAFRSGWSAGRTPRVPCTPPGRLAQLVEHLLYTQGVGGSSPSPPIKEDAGALRLPLPRAASVRRKSVDARARRTKWPA